MSTADPIPNKAPTFRSPKRCLVLSFRLSRDRWKNKALLRRQQSKSLQVRIRDLTMSRDLWKDKVFYLQSQLDSLLANKPTAALDSKVPILLSFAPSQNLSLPPESTPRVLATSDASAPLPTRSPSTFAPMVSLPSSPGAGLTIDRADQPTPARLATSDQIPPSSPTQTVDRIAPTAATPLASDNPGSKKNGRRQRR